ncbi:MAG: carbamate kinase [Thermoplasmata archaeon]|nr:carbamate kinase [Thermoplasmata archaeon]
MGRTVIALGGNALSRAHGAGNWTEEVEQMRATARVLAELAAAGEEIILTHGNGPQVGRLLRQNEIAEREVPRLPLDVLGAESEGQIGYLIAQELGAAMHRLHIDRSVLVLLGRIVVNAKDPSFAHPTKPIGQYYPDSEARLLRKSRGWTMAHDPARGGWRRLVPSPQPLRWVEGDAVRRLIRTGLAQRALLVVGGGGGIPVISRGRGVFIGVEAVIDKDLTAALIATTVDAQTLAIVTDVSAVAVGFGRPWERWLGDVSSTEMRGFLEKGEFGEGSMAPKVEAALRFLDQGGRRVVITDAPSLSRALRGDAGTRIHGAKAPARKR